MTRKAARAIIREHHVLTKQKVKAAAGLRRGEGPARDSSCGGGGGSGGKPDGLGDADMCLDLDAYQRASLQGQRADRGGDSSRVLVAWLQELLTSPPGAPSAAEPTTASAVSFKDLPNGAIRLLEIGALSTTNACSTVRQLRVERIDLHSREPGITQQDFMKRPLPSSPDAEAEWFDVISLSLVLNYVPDAVERGRMLRRTLEFLATSPRPELAASGAKTGTTLPCLFLVLPAACVLNSRYLDEDRLRDIMDALGYVRIRAKTTARLAYSLWHRRSPRPLPGKTFPKKEVRPGRTRNNFAIVLTDDAS